LFEKGIKNAVIEKVLFEDYVIDDGGGLEGFLLRLRSRLRMKEYLVQRNVWVVFSFSFWQNLMDI
jgi:hypothetical protein